MRVPSSSPSKIDLQINLGKTNTITFVIITIIHLVSRRARKEAMGCDNGESGDAMTMLIIIMITTVPAPQRCTVD